MNRFTKKLEAKWEEDYYCNMAHHNSSNYNNILNVCDCDDLTVMTAMTWMTLTSPMTSWMMN
jgi:hypothetical protein